MKHIKFLGYQADIAVRKRRKKQLSRSIETASSPYKLNFGPGPNWIRPDNSWLTVDVEPDWGDIVVNFQQFEYLPLEDNSCLGVYGSHVFEHTSIYKSPLIFMEIYRVLCKKGVLRIIIPDAEKSIREYLAKNTEFPLFKRRRERAKTIYGLDYTLFECMMEDFISKSGQPHVLGNQSLAHQNAWDYETLCVQLVRAGFDINKIKKMAFMESEVDFFDFEGTYTSEANQHDRSLYVEATK